MNAPPRVAIVGAGIGGLAAAHELQRLAEESRTPLEIVVLEAAGRAGGVLGTEAHEGALLERGPDSLVTHKPAGIALCRRLGLGDRLVDPPPLSAEILVGDRLLPIPAGFALLAPTRRWPLLESPLLGWHGKLRALCEPFVSRANSSQVGDGSDESVASFVRRRFGTGLLDRIVEPIVGAIYMADVERLSLAATFPRFLALEREHGSVTRGVRGARAGTASSTKPTAPPVALLSGGLGQIVDALVDRLPAGALRLTAGVESIRRNAEGFVLCVSDGESIAELPVAAVLLAIAAPAAARLLGELDPALAVEMRTISYASCVTVNLAWPESAVERPPRSSGFFVPGGAGSPLVAAGFLNLKFPERLPPSQIVARLFLGGALHPEIESQSDADLVEIATAALAPLLGLRSPPLWAKTFRHDRAMPQPAVDHLALVARLRAKVANQPGLELAGGPVGAYGLPDSIAAGESAAARLSDWVGARCGS